MAPLLIIAAGGTGGHMFPAQALAGLRVHLPREADHSDVHPRGIQAVHERLRSLDLGGENRVALEMVEARVEQLLERHDG